MIRTLSPMRFGTAAFVIAYIAACDGPTLTVDQIRQWKRRGYIRRVGTDPHGYALYDLNDVLRHVEHCGLVAASRRVCHSGRGGACPPTQELSPSITPVVEGLSGSPGGCSPMLTIPDKG